MAFYSLKRQNCGWGGTNKQAFTKVAVALASFTPTKKVEVRGALLPWAVMVHRRSLKNSTCRKIAVKGSVKGVEGVGGCISSWLWGGGGVIAQMPLPHHVDLPLHQHPRRYSFNISTISTFDAKLALHIWHGIYTKKNMETYMMCKIATVYNIQKARCTYAHKEQSKWEWKHTCSITIRVTYWFIYLVLADFLAT